MKTWLSILLCVHAVLMGHGILLSQRFKSLNTELPLALTQHLFQDSLGFLWIGTVNGLVRYDGYEIHLFAHDPGDNTSLAGNNINSLAQDHHGRIWVGLLAFGLDILNVQQNDFMHVCLPDSALLCMKEISVNGLALDHEFMWVGTNSGLMKFTLDSVPLFRKRFIHHRSDVWSLSNDLVMNCMRDSKGRLWIGTSAGINLLSADESCFVNYRTNPSFPSAQILDIEESPDGVIWLSPRFGSVSLYTFDEVSQNFLPAAGYNDRSLGELRVVFDHQQNLWISSRGMGAYYMDDLTGERIFFDPRKAAIHGFKNIYGLEALCDRYGNIWIAGDHLMQRPATGKHIFFFSVPEAPVTSLYATDTEIWFSDLEPRRMERVSGASKPLWPDRLPTRIRQTGPDSLRTRRVYAMQEYYLGQLIMTSTRNVFIWNISSNTFREYPLDFGGPFRDFIIDPDSVHLWICGNQGSPILLNLRTGETSSPPITRSVRNPLFATIANNGTFWFGSSRHGIFKVDLSDSSIVNFSPDQAEPSRRTTDYFINAILSTNRYVWAGTNVGINMIDIETEHVTHLRKQKGFENESVMSLISDNAGNVWIGTQQGLVRYEIGDQRFTRFDQSDGLINSVYSQSACFKDHKGILYFGGDKGVDIIDPTIMSTNSVPPDIHLSGIFVNAEPFDSLMLPHFINSMTLNHKQNFIELELLALHLTTPHENHYAYRILELDTVWRQLGTNRIVTLANMQPGEYTIQAKAANADGVWCNAKTLLHLSIMPPFWATAWFVSCSLLVFLGLIALLYRYRIRQINIREALKTDFNKRIAELESKALRAQMNPHFLFNSINSVKSLISQGENSKATQYLTRFGQLIRQILSNSEKPLVRLQEELEALRLYLEIEQLRFQNFHFHIVIGTGVNADFVEVPPLILQPYVENAIWHGLMHKTAGERILCIQVTRKNDFLDLLVEDNGIGRERAKQLKKLGDTRKPGMGMRLTSDRLHLWRQLYGREINIYITDLYTNNSPSGTRVEIRIPCPE